MPPTIPEIVPTVNEIQLPHLWCWRCVIRRWLERRSASPTPRSVGEEGGEQREPAVQDAILATVEVGSVACMLVASKRPPLAFLRLLRAVAAKARRFNGSVPRDVGARRRRPLKRARRRGAMMVRERTARA